MNKYAEFYMSEFRKAAQELQEPKKKKQTSGWDVALPAMAVLGAGGLGYYLWNKYKGGGGQPPAPQQPPQPVTEMTSFGVEVVRPPGDSLAGDPYSVWATPEARQYTTERGFSNIQNQDTQDALKHLYFRGIKSVAPEHAQNLDLGLAKMPHSTMTKYEYSQRTGIPIEKL